MFECGGQAKTERFKNADVITTAAHVWHGGPQVGEVIRLGGVTLPAI